MSAACCAPGRAQREERRGAEPPRPVAGPRDPQAMVRLEGGEFLMGSSRASGYAADGEGPVRKVRLRPLLVDRCTVTNAEFARFVAATGHVTDAERFGWSFVFHLFVGARRARDVLGHPPDAAWWRAVRGASWQAPEGRGSDLEDRAGHPVVHVSHDDALAYAAWAGKRLPSEAEWELAARGGLKREDFPWRGGLTPGGEHRCNVWQGTFPTRDTAEDGWAGTCPADAFAPNGFGLHNAVGNVWEWCGDWFSATHHAKEGRGLRVDPQGPPSGETRVIKGGSYLCHGSYCNRYRVGARSANSPASSTGNLGFRCAADA